MAEEPTPADTDRTRGTTTRWVIAGTAIAVLLAAGTWATLTVFDSPGCVDTAKPKSYRVEEMRESFDPRAVSPDGGYVAGVDQGPDRVVPTLWHDGEYTEIDVPDDLTSNLYPTDVNDDGVVVGTSSDPNLDAAVPWRYQDGESEQLTDPAGEPSPGGVDAVAADGTAVGQVNLGEPVLWPAGGTRATRLPLPESDDGGWAPHDISDAGVVASIIDGVLRVWEGEGKARELAKMPDYARPLISDDWVLADGKRWNLAEDREYPALDAEARFYAVDSCGRGYGGSGELDARPVVDDGKVRRLPELAQGDFERDEPENPYGRVHAASADGSVLIGESMGRPALWTHR